MGESDKRPLRVAVLISGRGSNLQSLVAGAEGLAVEFVLVLSNRASAAGLTWARERGLPTACVAHDEFEGRAAFEDALRRRLDDAAPDVILLAGFMRILGADFVRHFENRIINIHPSLLPAFPGLNTHAQALATGVQCHGCTVHYVTAELDHGPIIAQGVIPVLADDTPDRLAARLLPVEHAVYARVLRWLAQGRVQLQPDGRVRVAACASRAWAEAGVRPLGELMR